jgi:glycosyltransferase involved in cell wall biosynthesis
MPMKTLRDWRPESLLVVSVDLQSIGGVQEAVRRLLGAFDEQGKENRSFSLWQQGRGVSARLINLLRFAWMLLRMSRTPRWTVLITVTGFDALAAAVLCRFWCVPYVMWEHGRPDFFGRQRSWCALAPFVYSHAHAVVVLDDAFARDRFPPANYRVIPNFLRAQTFDITKLGRSSQAHASGKVFWVGRISPEKRPELGWALLESLAQQEASTDMLFVSDRRLFDPQERHHSAVRWVDGAGLDVQSMLKPSDVVLLTSTTEAMPMVLFEALCAGSFVVAADCSPWVSRMHAAGVGVAVPINAETSAWIHALQAALHESPVERVSRTEKIQVFLMALSSKSIFSMWMNVLDEN